MPKVLVVVAVIGLCALTYRIGELRAMNSMACMEDEARVVRVDTNPRHGLSWHCVSLDSL